MGGNPVADPVVFQKFPLCSLRRLARTGGARAARSKAQPFCDGSHKGTGFAPKKVDVRRGKDRSVVRLQAYEESAVLRREPQPPALRPARADFDTGCVRRERFARCTPHVTASRQTSLFSA